MEGIFVCRPKHLTLQGAKNERRGDGPTLNRLGFLASPRHMGAATPKANTPSNAARTPTMGMLGGQGNSRVRRDAAIIGKSVRITQGPLKGYHGIVKDATEQTARVELHTTCKTISVDRSRIQVVGDGTPGGAPRGISEYMRTPAGPTAGFGKTPAYAGSKTPMYGAQTPAAGDGGRTPHYGAQTPAYGDGGRTPGYEGGRTPAYDIGGRTPHYGGEAARTPAYESGSRTPGYESTGGRTPAYGGQTPARSDRHSSESPDSSEDEEQHEPREMEYESPASPMYSAPTPGSMNPLTPATYDAPASNYNYTTPMSPSNYYSAPTPYSSNDYDNAIPQNYLDGGEWLEEGLVVQIKNSHEDEDVRGMNGVVNSVHEEYCILWLSDIERKYAPTTNNLTQFAHNKENRRELFMVKKLVVKVAEDDVRLVNWMSFLRLMIDFCRENLLLTMTIISVILGVSLGFGLRPLNLSPETLQLINFPGEIFMQVLKMMILPLIFSSLVSALAQMDAKESGQMGLCTVLYYITTTILATMLGIMLVVTIHPGDPSVKVGLIPEAPTDADVSPLDTFLDLVRNMFPENILQASFERVQTEYQMIKPVRRKNSTDTSFVLRKRLVTSSGMNILGIIVFCTGFGIVISQLGEKARIVVDFFVILDAVIMKWVETLMVFAPLGITCLICGNLLELDDLSDTAAVLAMYVVCVMAGFVIHTVFVMPCVYFLVTRKNPLHIVSGMLQAIVTAFGTASGGATLPMSMQCLEDNCGIDRRITRFVLPLGSTINMDGNALYEAVAVVFIAQLNNVELSFVEVITVSITATVASIGLGSVPAGLVSILLILNTVGLPIKDVSLIITVDWLLDRVRTAVNVIGDGFASGAVAHLLQRRLEAADARHDYKAEIKEDIELLKSAANSENPSRRPSAWSELSNTAYFPAKSSFSGLPSRSVSRRPSTMGQLSWRHPLLDTLYPQQQTLQNV
ncbi:unnamed protein product, partial [Mesorhabditis belari]|uniref:Spt5 C-terminal domain-containing protein n=1 Tax=Mesorhabditis belari TaxID=2138241 RepID=A0AAF3FSE0_9BILA